MTDAPKIEIIYGPPGTGKTSYLLSMMSALGHDPDDIGFFSFTCAAAKVALDRLNIRRSATICTLHSLAFRLADARKEQMVDKDKLQGMAKLTGYVFNGNGDIPEKGDELLAIHTFAEAAKVPLIHAWAEMRCDWPLLQVELVSEAYNRWKRANGYMDFNGILKDAAKNLDGIKKLGLKALFIDEAQDLSPIQWDLVHALVAESPQTWIAGDDDQSLYLWAGSMRHGMRAYHERGVVKILDRSHRLPRHIHDVAEAIISQVKDRVPKTYAPKTEEGIVARWGELHFTNLPAADEDTLILYRNHSMREEAENWLVEHLIPYQVQGPHQGLFRGLTASAIRSLRRLQRGEEIGISPFRALCRTVFPSLRRDFNEGTFQKHLSKPWHEIVPCYDPVRFRYLNRVDLDTKPRVTLGTIHGSKGMEADRVILMLGMGERTYENFDDDEHRVFYVGATRAKHRLDVIDGPNPYPFPVRF